MDSDPYLCAAQTLSDLCPELIIYFDLIQIRNYIYDFTFNFNIPNRDLNDAADLLMTGLLFDIGARSPAGFHISYNDLQRATIAALRKIYAASSLSPKETSKIKN